jgi:hypothetical protein
MPNKMTTLISRLAHLQNHATLLIGLLLTAPVIFFQAFRFSFPLGYAGMFALMAEQIEQANFALPMTIPHYGPGGIAFVYPPFAMYVFALAIKLGIPSWTYLRLVPAVFMLLALIPLYYLALELTGSKAAALVSMVLLATAPAAFYTHVWSAGVVRALALGFCLTGLLFYIRTLKRFSWRNFLLAGFFLGLLFTTHWLYIVFAALAGLAFLIADWKPAHLPAALGILITALLVAAPWLGLILHRHGLSSILIASSSHGNTAFLVKLQDVNTFLQFIGGNLKYVTDNWFLAALAFPGLILLIAQRKFQLPLAFVFVLFMGEAFFYTVLLAVILAGAFCAYVFRQIPKTTENKLPIFSKLSLIVLVVLTASAVLFSATSGVLKIIQYQPEIDTYSLQMAKFIRDQTNPEATYLYIGKINEAEWFPYLLDRTPVFALWGSEWKGNYDQQSEALVALRECQLKKDWACMEALQQREKVAADLLVGPNQRWLAIQIKDTHAWKLLYTDDRYLVWEKLE